MSAAFQMPPGTVTLGALAPLPFWVAWQTQFRKAGDAKPTKLPYNPQNGRMAMADKPSTWGTREQAERVAATLPKPFGIGGVGLEFTTLDDGRSTGGIDLDSCRDPATGEIAPWATAVIEHFASYTEVSPSGTGVKVFFLYRTADTDIIRQALGMTVKGEPKHSKLWQRRAEGDHPPAIEVHFSNRYFAVTDQILPGATFEMREVPTDELVRLITVDGPAFVQKGSERVSQDEIPSSTARSKTRKRNIVGGDTSRSRDAFAIGGRARADGATFEQMCDAIKSDERTAEWYAEKGEADDKRELRRIWEKTDPATGELILSGSSPLISARKFLLRKHTTDGLRTLLHQNGSFYSWRDGRYLERTPEEMRARLYRFLDGAQSINEYRLLVPFNPNKNKVANVLEATAADAQLPLDIRPPAWLKTDAKTPPASEIIACKNTLLHLPSGKTSRHTPLFYTLNALDFDYEAKAPEPTEWKKFLKTLWPNDQQAIDTLQEMFGLCLTGETKYQKAFLVVGPKRSGKGTIARVMTQVLGAANVCGPTLSGLGTNFGLAPLIGKRLAIISDARLGGKADQQVIVERLLAITGEDGLTIDRKFRDGWTGKLDVRFLVLTNELPKLTDSSGALASRFVILTMTQSFYGKEDLGLGARLTAELPGILNWAVAGWRRLDKRGHFVPPASSEAAVRELEDLGSPIGAFLRERCDVAAGKSAQCDALYLAWCDWCHAQGRDHAGTKQSFGRDLRAAIPGIATVQPRTDGGGRERLYEGVGFKARGPSAYEMARDGTRTAPLQGAFYADDPGYTTDPHGVPH